MGLFNFLKKEKIQNENTSKPFHANTNNLERKDWFSKTRPWHQVDPLVINELIKIYDENPMFEVFVVASMENNLVRKYAELSAKGIEPDVAYTFIASILYTHGANASAQVGDIVNSKNINEKKLAKVYENAINLLESTVILDSNYVDAFVNLAGLRGMMNADDDALKYVRQGLKAINNLNESNVPFHKSNDENIRNTQQHLDATEKLLLDMERDFVPSEDSLILDIMSMFKDSGWSKEAAEKGAFLAVNTLSDNKAPENAIDYAAKQLTNDQLEEVIILVKAYQRLAEENSQ